MRKKLRVNLLIHAHTVGLRTDARVWRRALRECGVEASITAFTPQLSVRAFRALRKGAFRIASSPRYDINIFAEEAGVGFDNMLITDEAAGVGLMVVPEPATIASMGLALSLLGSRRAERRSRRAALASR